MEKYNKRYRDTVFRSYFNDADRLLTLCNALLNTDYRDAAAIQINTLEGAFFDRQKNDLSCKIGDNFLVLIEHQSSINENMPFRCLSYVAELMNNLVVNKRKLYHKALIMFPAPRFYVFYDGDELQPIKRQMRLSEAFSGDDTALELVVTALNINHGLRQPLLVHQLHHTGGGFADGNLHDAAVGQLISRHHGILNVFFVSIGTVHHRRDAALGVLGGGVVNLGFGNHANLAVIRGFQRKAKPRDTRSNN